MFVNFSAPPEFKSIYPRFPKRDAPIIIFYVIFLEKMYIQTKLKECIFRRKRVRHIRVNVFHLKLHKFAFYEYWSSRKGKRWDICLSGKLKFEFEVELKLTTVMQEVNKQTKITVLSTLLPAALECGIQQSTLFLGGSNFPCFFGVIEIFRREIKKEIRLLCENAAKSP